MVGALKSFQIPLEQYADDVRDIAGYCLERYGLEEWRAVVLTNEIHGHLGIYSTLGAKMGIFAAVESMDGSLESVVSFAGDTPPLSCFADGLQVGTGATLGHGMVSVSEDPLKRIEAHFAYRTQQGETRVLKVRLRESYAEKVRSDIAEATRLYGRTAPYWVHIRSLAIRYWRDWDRHDIFEIIP